MAKINIGGLLEGTAYGVINEILSGFRSDDGYAKPSRYEVTLHPPSGARGKPAGADTNIMSILMPQKTSEGTTRRTSLRCESIEFPGRNLDTTPDVNIYGPERNIVSGLSYADITGVFQCSTDLREKIFYKLKLERVANNPYRRWLETLPMKKKIAIELGVGIPVLILMDHYFLMPYFGLAILPWNWDWSGG